MPPDSLVRTSDSERPMISTVFRGDEPPETIRTPPPDRPRASLKRDSTAALALPRSAGAVTRTRNVSPSQPAMPFREEPGTTLRRSLNLTALNSRRTSSSSARPRLRLPLPATWHFDVSAAAHCWATSSHRDEPPHCLQSIQAFAQQAENRALGYAVQVIVDPVRAHDSRHSTSLLEENNVEILDLH